MSAETVLLSLESSGGKFCGRARLLCCIYFANIRTRHLQYIPDLLYPHCDEVSTGLVSMLNCGYVSDLRRRLRDDEIIGFELYATTYVLNDGGREHITAIRKWMPQFADNYCREFARVLKAADESHANYLSLCLAAKAHLEWNGSKPLTWRSFRGIWQSYPYNVPETDAKIGFDVLKIIAS